MNGAVRMHRPIFVSELLRQRSGIEPAPAVGALTRVKWCYADWIIPDCSKMRRMMASVEA